MFKPRIYLDYASLTPIDKRVSKEMSKVSKVFFANPSSLYGEGVLAHKKHEEARLRVAKCMEVSPDEIYFTSGGTESNNLAIQGLLKAVRVDNKFVPHVISLATEHPSVKEIFNEVEKRGGCTVTYVPVDETGIVDPREIKKALKAETVLVSVMYANNEIGVVQPISEIAKVIRGYKKEKGTSFPYFHTDACQAAAYLSLRVPALGVDMITLDGSKIYGPRSSGVLYVKRGLKLEPLLYGGSQEKELRPGTENVSHAVGFALALELCQVEREKEVIRLSSLRDELLECIKDVVPNVLINGDIKNRLPNNINICLKGIDAEFAVLKLDAKGVCVSSVTSCRAKNEDSSSYVVEALGTDCGKSSLRITLGRFTTKREVERAKNIIINVLTHMI